MNNEFEAKAININKDEIRQKLKDLGAELIFSERKFKRYTYDNEYLKSLNAWVRLRDEGDKISLTLKSISKPNDINAVKEALVYVNDIDSANELIQAMGFSHRNVQENLREEWKLGSVVFDIDTWPQIPTYLEIEASSEEEVKLWFEKLGLDYNHASFGSTDILYRDVYGIEILTIPELKFE